MPGLPMHCSRCGTSWEQNNFINVTGGGAITVTNSSFSSNCPSCGAGVTSSGSWQVTSQGWRDLYVAVREARDATQEDYERLLEILRRAKAAGETDGEQVASEVTRSVPSLAKVGTFLNSQKGDRVAFWIAAIAGLIMMLKTCEPVQDAPMPAPQVVVVQQLNEQELERLVENAVRQAEAGTAQPRSAKCACGSGLRYKRCCGASG